MTITCDVCDEFPARYRVAAPSGPEVTTDPQIASCHLCLSTAKLRVTDNGFVIGPAYVDPLGA